MTLQRLNANEQYVPLPRLCQTLGLDAASEAEYLYAYPVLAEGLKTITLPGEDGPTPTPCLRIDLVPFWLLTLQHSAIVERAQPKVLAFQRDCASVLWQLFRPQGFGTADALIPALRPEAVDVGYVGTLAQASLARHQLLIERQLEAGQPIDDPNAVLLARSVRRVAHSLAARTYRNEYGGVFQGLYRQFGMTSYRQMPPARLHEALEWLERWYGDIEGEPERPPDI